MKILPGSGLRKLIPDFLDRHDRRLFRKIASWRTPRLDRTLPHLSRTADYSRLWAVVAVLIALLGGRGGKRAAARGMASLGLTAALVNLPLKYWFRRKRPSTRGVPRARMLARMPKSASFPSGHAASALAFAVGASLEKPKVAVPLAGLAGGVAFSRVYVGVHYPGDVVVGALLGSAIAGGLTRVWPLPKRGPVELAPKYASHRERPLEDGSGLHVVVNPSAGSPMTKSPADVIAKELPGARVIVPDPSEGLDEAFGRSLNGGVASLGVAGGDGSIRAAAEIAIEEGVPLAVMPAGTLNHLALDLGLATLDDAIAAVKSGTVAHVDAARIDGRVFLNTASIGLYPKIVEIRERLEGRIGKWPAFVAAFFIALRHHQPLDVRIDGIEHRVWMIFIGNCRYRPSGFAPKARERLDDGVLDIRVVRAPRRYPRLKVLLWALRGGSGGLGVYSEWTAERVEIESLDGDLQLAADGESFDGPDSVVVQKIAKPMSIYVKASEA